MPRPAVRRAGHIREPERATDERDVTSSTRGSSIAPFNSFTAAIPASMLDTPTGGQFHTTPHRSPRTNGSDFGLPGGEPRQRVRRQGQDRTRRDVYLTTPVGTLNRNHDEDDQISSSLQLPVTDAESVDEDDTSLVQSPQLFAEDIKALAGLRDISSLATWTLSSAKPGCALAQLRHPSTSQFWQSDGPQPHSLTLHFFKLVCITKIRVYLDFKLDESYTPTKMRFLAGMSEGNLVEFTNWEVQDTVDPETGEMSSNVEKIRGWIDISLSGLGGCDTFRYEANEERRARAYERRRQQKMRTNRNVLTPEGSASDSNGNDSMSDDDDFTDSSVLRAMILQVRICENHQNGKDTHVRGFQVFAKDETSHGEGRRRIRHPKHHERQVLKNRSPRQKMDDQDDLEEEKPVFGLRAPDWPGERDVR